MAADRRLQTVVYAQPNLTELIDNDVMLFSGEGVDVLKRWLKLHSIKGNVEMHMR